MTCDTGRLIEYRDDALATSERDEVVRHLETCADCRDELARLQQRAGLLSAQLTALDPAPDAVPDVRAALAAVTAEAPRSETPWNRALRRLNMAMNTLTSGRRRTALVALAAVLILAAALSLAPVREAAAQFLSYFRVRDFEVVEVDESRTQQLSNLESLLDSGMVGEPEMLREPTEPVLVSDIAEASEIGGFDVRELPDMPEGVTLEEMHVATGPHLRFELQRQMIAMALAAAGITDVTLPDVDVFELEVDVPAVVEQRYMVGDAELQAFQMPSPTLTLPPGVPPEKLGEAYLQLLGVDPADAAKMASQIDWTSTMVIPMPEGGGRSREIDVDGSPGLLLQEGWDVGRPPVSMLMWQKDGVVYAVSGADISPSLLARLAAELD